LPVVVVDGASGRMKGGRHLVSAPHTHMSDLLLALLDRLGLPQSSFGDSASS